jgi:hypothetical protein
LAAVSPWVEAGATEGWPALSPWPGSDANAAKIGALACLRTVGRGPRSACGAVGSSSLALSSARADGRFLVTDWAAGAMPVGIEATTSLMLEEVEGELANDGFGWPAITAAIAAGAVSVVSVWVDCATSAASPEDGEPACDALAWRFPIEVGVVGAGATSFPEVAIGG